MTLEESIRFHTEEAEKLKQHKKVNEIILGTEGYERALQEHTQTAEWLKELQERRKADNEIPFGDSYSFTELDSIINAYEVHGGYYKEVVELLKELRERRKQSEIIHCKDCRWNDGVCYCEFHYRDVKPTDYCSWAERRTNDSV